FVNRRKGRREAEKILERVGIRLPSVRVPVALLSGGQRQAIAVARTLVHGAKIVMLDEPTAALGVTQSAQVMQLARDLAAAGRAAPMRRAGDWLVDYGVFVALAAVVAWFSVAIGGFFTWSTFATIGLSASEIGILAAVFTVALIAGQVDLSVGALTGVLGSV